ncbi:cytochrome P450 [Hypoxylon cercidicola]|nr:cytochrome P450 [Hypoxylon cercidicola]
MELLALGMFGVFLAGILCHHGIFIRNEWHIKSSLIVKLHICIAVVHLLANCYWNTIATSLTMTAIATILYALGLFGSIVIYRAYFHRLRHFPGPRLAGITKFWHVWKCRTGQNHLVLEKLYRQYGPFIRTGPEELTVVDPEVLLTVNAARSRCTKSPWYDFLHPQSAINTTRNIKDHDRRRHIWDRGFNKPAIAIYESSIVECTERISRKISRLAESGSAVNVTEWCTRFAFDVMGEFVFARSFGTLEHEQWRSAAARLKQSMRLLGPLSPVPWVARVAFDMIPWMVPSVRDWLYMVEWCKDRMHERVETKVDRPDVFHWLIEASLKEGSAEANHTRLGGDSIAAVVAGTDPVASTLIFAFYELARNPSHQLKLYTEVQDVNTYDFGVLEECVHLNAVIQETLRLHPAVPTGGYRQSPPEGVVINGTYVPGGITIVAPRYSISRLESCYEDADKFIPERWSTSTELVKDVRAFAPFARGRYGCVGKGIAMRELRIIIASLVRGFEIEMEHVDAGKSLFAESRDQFTVNASDLVLQFKIRK